MNIVIRHHEDVRFSAECGGHAVTIDLPQSHGGGDGGMTPPQLFIAALGDCAGVYMADYCDSQGIAYQGMRLTLDWDYVDRPRRISGVRLRLELPSGPLSPEQQQGIRASVQQCLLHNTLAYKPALAVEIVSTGAGGEAHRVGATARCESGACCRA